MQQQLAEEALRRAGYAGGVAEASRPGQGRREVFAWAFSTLFGDCEQIALAASDVGGGVDQSLHLSEEERWASKCKGLLALIGIDASIEAIRGCSEHDGACLLARLAGLVTAVSAHARDPAKAAAAAAAAHRLLDAACANPGRLCSDAAQLLPRDMALAVAAYGDQVAEFPQAAQDLRRRADASAQQQQQQQQQQQRQQQQQQQQHDDADHPTCSQPSHDVGAWARAMGACTAATGDLVAASDGLAAVYAQELSVWSASGAGGDSAPELGAPAADLCAGYRLARKLIEAASVLQDMHGTLQDVPREWLDSIAAGHSASAAELRDGVVDLLGDQ